MMGNVSTQRDCGRDGFDDSRQVNKYLGIRNFLLCIYSVQLRRGTQRLSAAVETER